MITAYPIDLPPVDDVLPLAYGGSQIGDSLLLAYGGTETIQAFQNGETGFISDPLFAFQTAIGTTAATIKTDPVGRLVNNAAYQTWTAFYTADFSAGVDGWTASNGTADGNIDSIQSLDNWLRLTVGASSAVSYLTSGAGRQWGNVNRRVTLQVYVPSGQSVVNGFRIYTTPANAIIYDGANMSGSVVSIDATYISNLDELRIYAMSGTNSTLTGASGQLLYVRAVVTYSSNLPHFFNATTAERPTLASIPFGGRRNLLTNNMMVGAVAGAPGTLPTTWTGSSPIDTGVARTITAVDTTNGKITIQWAGTSGATSVVSLFAPIGATVIWGVAGQATAATIGLRLAGGSLTNVTSIELVLRARDSGGTALTPISTVDVTASLTSSIQWFPVSIASLPTSTAYIEFYCRANFADSSAVDFTLEIERPQVVRGTTTVGEIQNVSNSNFLVTESGKPQVQSLYFDGVDNLTSGLAEWPGNLDFFCEAGKAFTINVCGNLLVRATAALFARYAAASGSRTLNITINSSTGFIGTELRGTTASALSGDWTDGTIRQFTLRWDGTTATVWADADASQTVGVGTAAEETSVSVTFGSRFSGVSPVTGYLFPPFAINRALTNAEVAQLHALNRARYGSR
jgi:gamma-glutamylcyclotransferase (GGCT)/AIG2-like uncharacterized protein YtfP